MSAQRKLLKKTGALPIVLGILNLLLAAGALWFGVMMLRGIGELFAEFPQGWADKLPFQSWTPLGFIALFFAAGNMLAAVLSLLCKSKLWLLSFIMGALLVLGMAAQVFVLREWYLATLEFISAAILQLLLSAILAFRKR